MTTRFRRHLGLGMLGALALLAAAGSAFAAEKPKVRLFILSGQSNMVGLNPKVSFTPALEEAFPDDEVIVVKHAQGGQPIRRWFKQWKPAPGTQSPDVKGKQQGDLYDALMESVKEAIGEKSADSIVFVWMQGERDAKSGQAAVYADSLKGLIEQLRRDLKRDDVGVVIGRLSDNRKGDAQWDAVRAAEVKVAEEDPRGAWVDTDDLNGPKDALHYTKEGYAELGRRFAAKVVEEAKK